MATIDSKEQENQDVIVKSLAETVLSSLVTIFKPILESMVRKMLYPEKPAVAVPVLMPTKDISCQHCKKICKTLAGLSKHIYYRHPD